ncbi:MAG: hypothetical protein ACRDMA_04015 [Solirubrobacterales bacterium]
MPTRSLVRPAGLTLACAAAISLLVPAFALAHGSEGVGLRVVGPQGQTLAQLIQWSGAVKVRTDPNALCFGQGTGGSGARVEIVSLGPDNPPTALGLVQEASGTDRDLRPLSLTDAFDFGLGVCGIGGFQAQGSASWYLKHNHVGAQVAGDQLPVNQRDEVLWYLAPSFPYPSELALEAPGRVEPGGQIVVEVVRYADDGTPNPAVGATVSSRGSPVTTDSQGRASVAVGSRDVTLRATSGSDIPSNEVKVCVAQARSHCSPQQLVAGSDERFFEIVKGTKLADKIKAGRGPDLVKARGGGPDRINCGRRRDTADVDANDTVRNCERVERR